MVYRHQVHTSPQRQYQRYPRDLYRFKGGRLYRKARRVVFEAGWPASHGPPKIYICSVPKRHSRWHHVLEFTTAIYFNMQWGVHWWRCQISFPTKRSTCIASSWCKSTSSWESSKEMDWTKESHRRLTRSVILTLIDFSCRDTLLRTF